MWEPRPLATLGASTACNRDIFTFFISLNNINRLIFVAEMCNTFPVKYELKFIYDLEMEPGPPGWGSLESETVGLGPEIAALARTSSNCKRQTRPLMRESAPRQQTRSRFTVIKIWSCAPNGCVTPRQTGQLTARRKITLTLTLTSLVSKVLNRYHFFCNFLRMDEHGKCSKCPR
jgi:hypothetical protein